MTIRFSLLTALAAASLFTACDRSPKTILADATPIPEPVAKTKTLETKRLSSAIDSYDAAPTADHAADVKKAVAALDGEIAELDARVAKTAGGDREEADLKRKNLQTYRDTQTLRFEAMRAKASVTGAPAADGRSGSQKAEAEANRIGGSVEDGAKRTGEALKDAGRDIKNAVKGN